MNKRGIATALVLAIIFGLTTVGLGTYIVYDNIKTGETNTTTESSETTIQTSTSSNTNQNNGEQTEQSSESTVKTTNGLNDENQEITNIIRKLALEKMPYFQINGDYKMKSARINKLEIYDEAYVSVEKNDFLEPYKHFSSETNNGKTVEAMGTISIAVDFDNEETINNIQFAGSGGGSFKNTVVISRLFYLNKTVDGKYELDLVTGW